MTRQTTRWSVIIPVRQRKHGWVVPKQKSVSQEPEHVPEQFRATTGPREEKFFGILEYMASGQMWVAFGLYMEWAVYHIGAGYLAMTYATKDPTKYVSLLCGGAPSGEKEDLKKISTWNSMTIRILLQQGINLFVAGLYAVFVAIFAVTNLNRISWYLGLYPFLAGIAEFCAIDTVHYGRLPGQAQTLIIAIAQILISLGVARKYSIVKPELVVQIAASGILLTFAVGNKVLNHHPKSPASPPHKPWFLSPAIPAQEV